MAISKALVERGPTSFATASCAKLYSASSERRCTSGDCANLSAMWSTNRQNKLESKVVTYSALSASKHVEFHPARIESEIVFGCSVAAPGCAGGDAVEKKDRRRRTDQVRRSHRSV